ncbi:MAG: hypothetical protein ACTSQY_02885, partial [Candidatus Odinarchaeia archaeon]
MNFTKGFQLLFGKQYLIHTVIMLVSMLLTGIGSFFLATGYLNPAFKGLSIFGISIGHAYLICALLSFMR